MQRNLPGRLAFAAVFSALFLTCLTSPAQDLKSFEQRITTKVLPNGLTILICERPEAQPAPALFSKRADVEVDSGRGVSQVIDQIGRAHV